MAVFFYSKAVINNNNNIKLKKNIWSKTDKKKIKNKDYQYIFQNVVKT